MFFQEGSSDKLYHVALVEVADGQFTVEVEWGRRGSPLRTGTKAVKVDRETAQKAYDKVVRQKTKKGYEVVTEEHRPASVAPPEGEGSASKVAGEGRERLGQRAQLLNHATDERLEELLDSEHFLAQQKLDGMRVLVHVRAEREVIATNRDGHVTRLDQAVSESLAGAPEGTIFDGEMVAGESWIYWVFDLLRYGDEDLRELGYADRYERLQLIGVDCDEVTVVPTAFTAADKRELFETLQQQNAEGIVFKTTHAPYTPGRPASGGTQLKYKFIKSADVVITENVGNAYQMAVYQGDRLRAVGKVFAGTTNASRAELDERLGDGETPVVEVQYLYATDDDILYQPVFVRFRPDKSADDCSIEQLVRTNREVVTDF